MTFDKLTFEETFDGVQAWIELPNGYEVSVIKNGLSYGGEKGLYEIGIYKGEAMADPLGWGDTVKGWLTPYDVEVEISKIKSI
jgi:hypothetical protein